jgi:hypothetical protein
VIDLLFGASVIGSFEDNIFLLRTPNDLVLFPGYAEYQVLLDRKIILIFGFFEFIWNSVAFILETGTFSRQLNRVICLSEAHALDLRGHEDNEP